MFPFADNNPTHRTPVITYALILANVLAFLWFWRLDERQQILVTFQYGFMPARIEQLQNNEVLNVKIGQPKLEQVGLFVAAVQPVVRLEPDRPEVLRSIFTCMFLHGSWMHLIGNMWFLYLFGNNIEDRLGHILFPIFYIAGGLLATAAHYAMYTDSTVPVIGASGAVAAILGAYAVTYPFARVHTLVILFVFVTVIDLPALAVLGIWFLGQLMSFYGEVRFNMSGGVAFLAHIGGFVAGAIAMPFLNALVPHPEQRQTREEPEAQYDDRSPFDRW
ncbi:MAG: rhomboid family intramembrane serine protease [Pirellulales bacterium]